jgi:TMEM175 potassium channel family protein
MGKSRLEAFSDGVIAIIITIMVLELKAPHEPTLEALRPLVPVFLSYALSFLYVGIYWNNHHHLLQAARRVSGSILWANLHLLFWLSLVPFATAWMDENHYATVPTMLYGAVLFMAAIAYLILQHLLIKSEGADSVVKRAVGSDWKGKFSPLVYVAAIILASWSSWLPQALFVGAALVWLIPDRRIEHQLRDREPAS